MKTTRLIEAPAIQKVIDGCASRGIGFCGLSEPWIGASTRLIFLCGKHGAWRTTTYKSFMRGAGCNQCGMEKLFKAVGNTKRITEADWIERFVSTGKFHSGHSFKRMHKVNRWVVSCSVCKSDEFSVAGLCSGEFEVDQCLLKLGKPPCRCAGTMMLTPDQRIYMMNKIASDRGIAFIGWDDVFYKNPKSIAVLSCKEHGEFKCRYDSFLYVGSGCPSCTTRGFRPSKRSVVYALISDCDGYIKIGISNKPKQRMKELTRSTPFKFSVHSMLRMRGACARHLEKSVQSNFMSAGFRGFCGATEWLRYDPAIIDYIKQRAL